MAGNGQVTFASFAAATWCSGSFTACHSTEAAHAAATRDSSTRPLTKEPILGPCAVTLAATLNDLLCQIYNIRRTCLPTDNLGLLCSA